MTTSSHWAPPAPPEASDDFDFDLLVDEAAASGSSARQASESDVYSWTPPGEGAEGFEQHTGSHAPASNYVAAEGPPGRGVIVSAAFACAALAVLDLALVGRLSIFFDLSFVVVCLVAAMAVRARDLFTAAVLPPLAFGATIAGVALLWPDTIAPHLGLVATFLAGLATHATGLIFGCGTALLTVAARASARRRT